MKSQEECVSRIRTLTLAIDDALERIEGHIKGSDYYNEQSDKIKRWWLERETLEWVIGVEIN
jgi:hypothetical protein